MVEPPPLSPLLGEEGNLLLNSPPAANTLGQGAGVIWNGDPVEPPVISAKVGIHSANLRKCPADGLDSRFRANDCAPNDTPASARERLSETRAGWYC